jgi:hypothetical protein
MEHIIPTAPIQPTPLVTEPPSGKGREGNGRRDERTQSKSVRKQPHPPEEPDGHPAIRTLRDEEVDSKGGKIDLTA